MNMTSVFVVLVLLTLFMALVAQGLLFTQV